MGGFGSGSRTVTRPVVENFERVSSYELMNRGVITPDMDRTLFRFWLSGQLHAFEVALAWRPQHLGGYRAFFLCPDCGGRKVYLTRTRHGGLSCAKCLDLPNRSRQLSDWDRKAEKLRKLKCRLGAADWENTLTLPLFKPKHMQWETFSRLSMQARELQHEVICGGLKWLPGYK